MHSDERTICRSRSGSTFLAHRLHTGLEVFRNFYYALRFACKLRTFASRPAWTRTRDRFLIRDNRICYGGSQVFKNTCKTLLFTFMSVLHVHHCSGALSSNCRQSSDLRRAGQTSSTCRPTRPISKASKRPPGRSRTVFGIAKVWQPV